MPVTRVKTASEGPGACGASNRRHLCEWTFSEGIYSELVTHVLSKSSKKSKQILLALTKTRTNPDDSTSVSRSSFM